MFRIDLMGITRTGYNWPFLIFNFFQPATNYFGAFHADTIKQDVNGSFMFFRRMISSSAADTPALQAMDPRRQYTFVITRASSGTTSCAILDDTGNFVHPFTDAGASTTFDEYNALSLCYSPFFDGEHSLINIHGFNLYQ